MNRLLRKISMVLIPVAALGGAALAQTDEENTGISVDIAPPPGPLQVTPQQNRKLYGPRGAMVKPGAYMLRAIDAPQSCMHWIEGGLNPRYIVMKPCHVVPTTEAAMLSSPQLFTILPHPAGGMTIRAANTKPELPWRNTDCATIARGVIFGAPRIDLHPCENNHDNLNSGAPDQRFNIVSLPGRNAYTIMQWQESMFEADCVAVRDVPAAADYSRSLNENIDLVRVGCDNRGRQFELIYVGTYPNSDPSIRNFDAMLNAQDWFRGPDGYVRLNPVNGIDLLGETMNVIPSRPGGARECASICMADTRCRAFTWYAGGGPKAPQCSLKSSYTKAVAGGKAQFASGIVRPM